MSRQVKAAQRAMTKGEQHFPHQEAAPTCKLEYLRNLCQTPAVQRGGWLMAGVHPGTSGAPVCSVCDERWTISQGCVWFSGHEESTAGAWNHSTALARLVRLSSCVVHLGSGLWAASNSFTPPPVIGMYSWIMEEGLACQVIMHRL